VVACGCIGCLVYWYQPSGRQRSLESLPGQDPYPLGPGATGPTPGINGWGHCMTRQGGVCATQQGEVLITIVSDGLHQSNYRTKCAAALALLRLETHSRSGLSQGGWRSAWCLSVGQPIISKESTHMRVVLPGECQVASIMSRLG